LLLPRSRTRVHVDGPSPRIVEGGPGSQGRAGLALVALIGSVAATAAAVATVASAVLTIAATVAPLSLTLGAIARGMRRSRGRRGRSVVAVERLRGRCWCVGAEREFLKTRSSQTLWMNGDDVVHVMMAQR
jgi:hypothetical protein